MFRESAELIYVALFSLVIGVVVALVAWRFRAGDPAAQTAERIDTAVAERGGWRRFLRARFTPGSATGLALTLTLLAVLLLFAVFGVIIVMVRTNTGVVLLDSAIARWAAANASRSTLIALANVTHLGATITVAAVGLIIGLVARWRWHRWTPLLFLVVVVGGQNLLMNSVKFLVARVRPDVSPYDVFSGFSFPSGHSTAAAACWAAFALVIGRHASPRVRAVLAGVAAAIAVAVACSRVFLGAHWTSDVVGGLLLGTTWYAVCAVAFGGRWLRFGTPAQQAEAAPARDAD